MFLHSLAQLLDEGHDLLSLYFRIVFDLIISIYNATTQNKRKIDRVHNYGLYIASVSIKLKAVDGIKTALQFWFNSPR